MSIELFTVVVDKTLWNFRVLTLNFGDFSGSLFGIEVDKSYILTELFFHIRAVERKRE